MPPLLERNPGIGVEVAEFADAGDGRATEFIAGGGDEGRWASGFAGDGLSQRVDIGGTSSSGLGPGLYAPWRSGSVAAFDSISLGNFGAGGGRNVDTRPLFHEYRREST